MLVYKKGRFSGDYLPRHGSLCTFAPPLPKWFLDFAMSMVAFGDRKDFLQVLRMGHFLRKCPMRKTCKRDTERREVCSFMESPPSKQFRIRFPLRAVPLSVSDLLLTRQHGNSSGSERPCRCARFTVFF